MPQEFHVLRCFSCETFQVKRSYCQLVKQYNKEQRHLGSGHVHIVKKDRKWECKMCGTKQSLKRNYGRGTAKDCRNHVMKLNELRLTKESGSGQNEDEIFERQLTNSLEKQEVKEVKKEKEVVKSSKWDEYLEDNTNNSKSDTDEDVSDFFLSTEKKKKRNKKSTKEYYPKSKKICMESSRSEVFSKPDEETIPLFSSVEKKFNKEKSPVKIENKLQRSKYAKYVDEEGGEDELTEEDKCLNIFESEPVDLDNLLKFE